MNNTEETKWREINLERVPREKEEAAAITIIYTNRGTGSGKLKSQPPWNVKESDRWEFASPPSSLPSLITFLFGVLMFTVASIKFCRDFRNFQLSLLLFFCFVLFFVVMAILIFNLFGSDHGNWERLVWLVFFVMVYFVIFFSIWKNEMYCNE